MEATVVQVSTSHGGVPKRAISVGHVTTLGIAGDSWAHPQFHGGPLQAVLLIASEVIEELKQAGFPVFPGALGENITTHGLDVAWLRSGQRYRLGGSRIELTKVRVPCNTIKIYGGKIAKEIYGAQVKAGDWKSPLWARSGFYARVIHEGDVTAGDSIELESELA